MKLSARLCALLLLAASASCNYMRPVMYVEIANRSGQAVESVEVKHPARGGSGQFGLPRLGEAQVHREMIPAGEPCRFSIDFDDPAGKHHSQSFDLGAKCPTEILFEIGGGMTISQRTVRP